MYSSFRNFKFIFLSIGELSDCFSKYKHIYLLFMLNHLQNFQLIWRILFLEVTFWNFYLPMSFWDLLLPMSFWWASQVFKKKMWKQILSCSTICPSLSFFEEVLPIFPPTDVLPNITPTDILCRASWNLFKKYAKKIVP